MFQIVAGKKVQGEHNTRLEYSTNFFAVLHQIKKLDCVSSDIFQLSEVPIQVYILYVDQTDHPGIRITTVGGISLFCSL